MNGVEPGQRAQSPPLPRTHVRGHVRWWDHKASNGRVRNCSRSSTNPCGVLQQGLTIIEMVITLAIVGMAAAGAEQLLAGQIRHLSRQETMAEQRQEGRAAVAVLVRELSLAGLPVAPDPACHAIADAIEADGTAVRFLANLYGVATVLEEPAAAGDTVLWIPDDARIRDGAAAVSPGTAFAAHDVVYLYDLGRAGDNTDDRVECHRLDRAGRAGVVALAAGDTVRHPFPAGSRLQVVNDVRYALDSSRHQLMRTVDGGTQAIADRLDSAQFIRQEGRVAVRMIFDPRPAAAGIGVRRDEWETLVAMRNAQTLE
jgi:prepilin-type N-terminal cleavage/methylation domain-containing protein